jgi:hypothetical protein
MDAVLAKPVRLERLVEVLEGLTRAPRDDA